MGTGKVPIQQVIFGFLWENRWFRALIFRLAQLREWLSMPSLQRGLQRAEQITVRHAFVPNTIQIMGIISLTKQHCQGWALGQFEIAGG